MKHLFKKLIQSRVALPLLIAVALSLAVVSELTYRRAESTLTGGIKLTEARLGAAKLLQLLTDAETAQRGYLLTSNPAYLQPLRLAEQQFNQSAAVLDFIASISSSGPQDALGIRRKVTAKFAELDQTVALAAIGDRSLALELVKTDSGKQLMDELRELFRKNLDEATLLQAAARQNIYAALLFNRLAVLFLAVVLASGILVHLVQLRAFNRVRLSYEKSLENTVSEKTLKLKTLAAWLETAREDEKSHLARELHDELGGLLTGAKLTLARMRVKLTDNPEMLERITTVNQLLNEGIALKRRIIEDLRPSTLSLLGLRGALEALCSDASRQLAIPVITDIADLEVSPIAELALFRVVQEALTNIGKYANASHVAVNLSLADNEIVLKISDNGVGFKVSTREGGKHGLMGMRFRMESHAGSLLIESAPQNGTHVTARLPITAGVPANLPPTESMPATLSLA